MEAAARNIAETVESGFKIVVEKSTVPVKAAESIATILKAIKRPGVAYQARNSLFFIWCKVVRTCNVSLLAA